MFDLYPMAALQVIIALLRIHKYPIGREYLMQKTDEQISYNMSRIRSKDTSIEVLLRRELWKRGLRYRKNYSAVTGKPDIVFKRRRIAVFCDSEFWHGYDWETRKQAIKSNREYWIPKIERNIKRDLFVNSVLREQGWIVLRFWGKEIRTSLIACADIIEKTVRSTL